MYRFAIKSRQDFYRESSGVQFCIKFTQYSPVFELDGSVLFYLSDAVPWYAPVRTGDVAPTLFKERYVYSFVQQYYDTIVY